METTRLTQPLRDLAAWTAFFRSAEIPVLAQSAGTLEDLRLNEDAVDANLIGETFSGDPLMIRPNCWRAHRCSPNRSISPPALPCRSPSRSTWSQ